MAGTYGKGTVRYRGGKNGKPGRFEYRITVGGKRRSFYGLTRADALAGPDRAVNAATIARDGVQAARGVTVAEYMADWLAAKRQTVKPATWVKYESVIRCAVVPEIGSIKLREVNAATLTGMYARLGTRLSQQSVRHAHVVTGSAFEDAVMQGLLASNPSRTVKAPRVAAREREILDRSQSAALLRAARGDRLEALYLLALTTGMREGELLALRWRDVDFSRSTVSVNGTVTVSPRGGREIGPPKTKNARRTVRVIKPVLNALRARYDAVVEASPREGYVPRDTLVFPSVGGYLMGGTNLLNRSFRPLLERAGLPRIAFHDLRHTAITHMLEDGTPAHVVSRIAGHASVAVTLGLYGHVSASMDDAAVEAMERRYSAA
jgi:integrase